MLKIFISYSHADETAVTNFIQYMKPLTLKNNVEFWHDRKIRAGEDFWASIDSNLENGDIICVFLSPTYLASNSCSKELNTALDFRKSRGTTVIPIVLTKCRWHESNPTLGKLLAATKDAKTIDSFEKENEGWDEVFEYLQDAITRCEKLKALQLLENHKNFLNDATILSKAHPEKNTLALNDIFVSQELTIVDNNDNDKKTTVLDLLNSFEYGHKYLISGDDQSGKTSILKRAFTILFENSYIPIYVKDPQELLQGRLDARCEKLFKEQYCTECSLGDYEKDRVVLLIDDFHKAKNIEKVLTSLQYYNNFILVVDEIFSLDVRQEQLVIELNRYRIRELKPSLRNQLIRNWLMIREGNRRPTFSNEELQQIDETTSFIDQSIGKVWGRGLMPAHPFFILYVLSTHEYNTDPKNNPEITSQGHCYQALIYMLLRSHGVSNDRIDAYYNYLTELAYAIYQNDGRELTSDDFEDFNNQYGEKFNFIEKKTDFVNHLLDANIICISSFNNISFGYPYLYYFFAGKFFSEQWNDTEAEHHIEVKENLSTIIDNLHKTANAYITIFIAHHTKTNSLLRLIMLKANGLYAKYSPTTLSKDCLNVFGNTGNLLPSPSISNNNSAAKNRSSILERQDEIEEQEHITEKIEEVDDDEFSRELRRSFKTVEVIGYIIKNRAGSLTNDQLSELFVTGVNVHLRHFSSFLKLIDDVIKIPNYSDFIVPRIASNYPKASNEDLRTIANKLFWGLNFATIFGVIKKISQSLGTNKISRIITQVCDDANTPAMYMIKHTILMWSNKNLRIDELKEMELILDSPITQNIMRWLIADYCSMHYVDYKDAEKLKLIGIRSQSLLPNPDKIK